MGIRILPIPYSEANGIIRIETHSDVISVYSNPNGALYAKNSLTIPLPSAMMILRLCSIPLEIWYNNTLLTTLTDSNNGWRIPYGLTGVLILKGARWGTETDATVTTINT